MAGHVRQLEVWRPNIAGHICGSFLERLHRHGRLLAGGAIEGTWVLATNAWCASEPCSAKHWQRSG